MPVELVPTAGDNFIFPEKEFSILGDGSNEVTKLQAAINLASVSGRILVLPPFEIVVGSIITIPSTGVRIWGQSGNTSAPKSIIRSTFNGSIFLLDSFQRDVEFSNFIIKGGKSVGTLQHGLHITGSSINMINIHNLIITECGGNGVHILSSVFSYVLRDILSSDNAGQGFFIDAFGSPCVTLENCYAGIVAQNKYGFYINRGYVEMINCNSLDGGTSPVSCVRVGDAGSGAALVVFRNCNFEDFTLYGVHADSGSDTIFWNCKFAAGGAGAVQPIYLVQPTGKSFIDQSTQFSIGGASYDNASGLPIKIFSRWINAPYGCDPIVASSVYRFHNSDDGRSEPMMNVADRAATQSFSANYTEHGSMPGYYGCTSTAAARALVLLDPQSIEVPDGRRIIIKDESGGAAANNITITTVNSRTIDGAASAVISTNYGRVTLVKRGNNYWRVD